MELIFRPEKNNQLILKAISQFANSPEHHHGLYDSLASQWEKVYCHFLDNSGILALRKGTHWRVLGAPLTRPEERIAVLFAFLEHLFSRKEAERITLQSNELEKLLDLEKHTSIFRVGPVTRILHYPVFSFDTWNGDQPSVHKINHQLRQSELKAKEAKDFTSAQLKKFVLGLRAGKGEYSHLFNLIDSGFEGMKTRVLEKNDNPVSLMAWWNVAEESFLGVEVAKELDLEIAILDAILQIKETRARKAVLYSPTSHDLDIKNKLHPSDVRQLKEFSLLNL
ncbi:MAG: hypothetical protein AABX51_09170 [Nanoarchaeota archaeon]